jgi:hypothetical protein
MRLSIHCEKLTNKKRLDYLWDHAQWQIGGRISERGSNLLEEELIPDPVAMLIFWFQ